MEKKTEVKQLSKKRWIPMIGFMLVGVIIILSTRSINSDIFKYSIYIFDFPHRTPVIWWLASVVGLFHFWYITKRKQESRNVLIKSSISFADSMFSAWGYAFVLDKSMNIGAGTLKEIFHIQNFFIDPSQVDYWSICLVVLIVMFIGVWKIWSMAVEALFEIKHPLQDASTPVASETKGE